MTANAEKCERRRSRKREFAAMELRIAETPSRARLLDDEIALLQLSRRMAHKNHADAVKLLERLTRESWSDGVRYTSWCGSAS